jgi:hypothetical protein
VPFKVGEMPFTGCCRAGANLRDDRSLRYGLAAEEIVGRAAACAYEQVNRVDPVVGKGEKEPSRY